MIKFTAFMLALIVQGPILAAGGRKIPAPSGLAGIIPTETLRLKDGDSVTLRASFVKERIGKNWVTRLAYNRQIPGPTIVVKRGSALKVRLVNETGEPTALHSHGLRVDDKNDGVVGIGQDPIPHGGEMTYQLKFPDRGIYWYHPHLSDEYAQEMGLQGNFLVEDAAATGVWDPGPVDREEVLMLDDILMEKNQLPYFIGKSVTFALMGRYGNHMTINNRRDWRVSVKRGDIARFWLTNSANARPFKIKFQGAVMKWRGSDNGMLESDELVESITLAPSERALVEVFFPAAGSVRVVNAGPKDPVTMGVINVAADKKRTRQEFEERERRFKVLADRVGVTDELKTARALAGAKPDIVTRIDAAIKGEHADHVMGGSQSGDGIEWEDSMSAMGSEITSDQVVWKIIDEATGKENMDINWKFKKDIPVKIKISNQGKNHPMQHPIHFHGQRFVVITRNGKEQKNLGWKDTALIPAGETMEVVLDNHNSGRWMGHCHISEHLGSGMMFGFEVN
jgi:suppressor of ftsI